MNRFYCLKSCHYAVFQIGMEIAWNIQRDIFPYINDVYIRKENRIDVKLSPDTKLK